MVGINQCKRIVQNMGDLNDARGGYGMVIEARFHERAVGFGTTVDDGIPEAPGAEVALNGMLRCCHGTMVT